MPKTIVRPSRDLRNKYADIVASLKQNDHVIITNNGVGESVLIGIQEYAEYEEYLHRRFVYNELQKSKSLLNNPDAKIHDSADVFKELEAKLKEHKL